MSLTLNISKEARLFYKIQKSVNNNRNSSIIPSSTIHMKKCPSQDMFPELDDQYSEDEKSMQCVFDVRGDEESTKTDPMNERSKFQFMRRDRSKYERGPKRPRMLLDGEPKSSKRSPVIPVRDLEGLYNSDEDSNIAGDGVDHTGDHIKGQKSRKRIIDKLENIDIEDSTSTNNPFAKQRLLKSRYKERYSS